MSERQSKSNDTSHPKKKLPATPQSGTPMDGFNKAMRKILSVPKKDLDKK